MATKSKKATTDKDEFQVSAAEVSSLAADKAEDGLIAFSAGAETLGAAKTVRQVGGAALVAGASEVTRGVDQINNAAVLGALSQFAAEGGEGDLADGAAALAASEDIQVQSAIVGVLSAADLARGMELAAMAGRLKVAGEIVAFKQMPVLSAFLAQTSKDLHDYAVGAILRFGATRALSQSMTDTAAVVASVGADEVAEGLQRQAMARAGAELSRDLAAEGAARVVVGVESLEMAEDALLVARELEKEGVREIAAGAEAVGQAEAIDAVASALDQA
jgi:hypothetical protein